MAMQLPSSSSSASSSVSNDFTYDVFISFRGTDTRFGFTGNLCKALTNKGIHTFIDDKELPRGGEITPSLLKSIEDSRIAIVILSKNYASSSFCLDELVHIIHYFKEKSRLVLPVFYDVEPSHVRHQTNRYGEALAEFEERFQNNKVKMDRLQKWKIALKQAADLSGYHFNPGKEYEHSFIEKIVEDVSNKIKHIPLHVAGHRVGLESQILEVNSLLDLGSSDGVYIIGIHGTGGIGKTTLVQEVYNLIANQFECLCFLHDVRENSVTHGLAYLQEQLLFKSIRFETKFGHVNEGIPIIRRRLCQKKVLLILDDVDKLKQLQALIGEPGWLGHGSRVIITTRDKHLLSCHGIKTIYEVDGLNQEDALELLRWKAFKGKEIDACYDSILNRVVKYASGLPLALEVVGSNLCGKGMSDWECTLDKYERIPPQDIQSILKISFDALDEEQKSVFLDIACCFKWHLLVHVEKMLSVHYGHSIKNDVGVLVDKSLIKIGFDNNVTLHDLIEDMGKEIVRQESPEEAGKRSRLWSREDIFHVLKENTGTRKIEMIYLNSLSIEAVVNGNEKAFKKMTNLKTLVIGDGHGFKGDKCPLKSPSSSIFSKMFDYMKVSTSDYCEYLTHIPNISGLPNLEHFSFPECNNLITIDDSVGQLKLLREIGCVKLESFPPLFLESFQPLQLSGNFAELLRKMAKIGELPFSFQNFSELGRFELWRCGMLRFQNHNDIMYSNVKELCLAYTNLSDECLPILLTLCPNLEELNLSGNNFKTLPECFSECHLLRFLSLDGCKFLEEIKGFPPNLESFYAGGCDSLSSSRDECLPILLTLCPNLEVLNLSRNNFKTLPECFSECHLLRVLELNKCKFLEEIKGFPPNLESFCAEGCDSLSSSSRKMLLSEQLHDAGCTDIILPNGTEGIPDWFEHQSRGHSTISFWFRKKIPSIACILIPTKIRKFAPLNLFVNGYRCIPPSINYFFQFANPERTYLFDLDLEEQIEGEFASEMGGELLKNKWIHAKLNWGKDDDFYLGAQMGIHVLKEKSNTEKDVIFTVPYSRKRKLDDDINASLTQFEPPLKKQRLVEVGVSETEEEDGFSDTEEDDILNYPYSRKTWGTFVGLGLS